MSLLRFSGEQPSAFEQERASLLRKQFAASNRKLEAMIAAGAAKEYVLNASQTYKMIPDDMSDKVRAYVADLLKKEPVEAKEPKKASKKSEKASESKSEEPAAE